VGRRAHPYDIVANNRSTPEQQFTSSRRRRRGEHERGRDDSVGRVSNTNTTLRWARSPPRDAQVAADQPVAGARRQESQQVMLQVRFAE
jgi:hypothetical protein